MEMDVKGEWVVQSPAVDIGVLTCFFMLNAKVYQCCRKTLAVKCVEVLFFIGRGWGEAGLQACRNIIAYCTMPYKTIWLHTVPTVTRIAAVSAAG